MNKNNIVKIVTSVRLDPTVRSDLSGLIPINSSAKLVLASNGRGYKMSLVDNTSMAE